MRQKARSFLVCLVAATTVIGTSDLVAAPASQAAGFHTGQLGVVQIIVRGLGEQPPNSSWKIGKVRDPLYSSYFLRTKRRQKARLKFADGTTLNLNQRTDAVLQDPHHLIVRQGEVDQVDAKGSVHHIAGNAVAATGLGTNYDVKVVAGKVFITVVQGRVAVKNVGGSVIVRPNQQTIVTGSRRPTKPTHVNALAVIAWVRGLDSEGWVVLTPPVAVGPRFQGLHGIATDSRGNVFVTSADEGRIAEYTSTGKPMRAWTASSPNGIAIDQHDVVYVSTHEGVTEYSATGQQIRSIGIQLTRAGVPLLGDASALAVDGQGNLYAVSPNPPQVTKASPTGASLAVWGGPEGSVKFSHPQGIAVDDARNVYVADTGAGSILKLSANGQLLARWHIQNSHGTTSNGPNGVAVDTKGHVYVASSSDGKTPGLVYQLSRVGKIQFTWGTHSNYTLPGRFYAPQAIVVDRKGNIYVADSGNKRIEKLPYFGH